MSFQKAKEIHAQIIADREQKVKPPRRKFTVLRAIATFFKVVGIIGLVMLIFSCIMLIASDRIWLALFSVGLTGLSCISSIAIGEAIFVFLDIEENTSAMKEYFLRKND